MNKHNVTVYSTPTCPYCVYAKRYLDEKKVAYKDIDVSEDFQGAMELAKKSGQMGVPVIDIDGQIVIGYQPEAFDKLLA